MIVMSGFGTNVPDPDAGTFGPMSGLMAAGIFAVRKASTMAVAAASTFDLGDFPTHTSTPFAHPPSVCSRPIFQSALVSKSVRPLAKGPVSDVADGGTKM